MKFNTKTTNHGPGQKTTNYEGGEAYTLDDSIALYVAASTSLGGGQGDKFYQTAKDSLKQITALVQKVAKKDPEFIFQLAAYLRQEMYLRSIPVVLFVEGIRALKAQKADKAPYPFDVRPYARLIYGRADEIVETGAYWFHVEGHNINLPKPLRAGLEVAFNKFDEYGLLKYDRDGTAVSFKDMLKLVHPKPNSEAQEALFRYVTKGELNEKLLPKTAARKRLLQLDSFGPEAIELIKESAATWETVNSKFGSRKEVWEAALPNMGYMAGLKNVRNLLEHGVDVKLISDILTNPRGVKHSKQLPFRFLSAMKAVNEKKYANARGSYSDVRNLFDVQGEVTRNAFAKWESDAASEAVEAALAEALNISIENVPRMPGRTLIATDLSGSMEQRLNKNSTVTACDIGLVMSGIAASLSEDNIVAGFGNTFAVAKPGKNVLDTAKNIAALRVGHATNAYLILDYLVKNRIFVDRVIYFTDTVCYGGSMNTLWNKYKDLITATGRPAPYLYEVNLAGYTNTNFRQDQNVIQLAGWSDKIFDLMTSYETDPRGAVKKIKEKYAKLVA